MSLRGSFCPKVETDERFFSPNLEDLTLCLWYEPAVMSELEYCPDATRCTNIMEFSLENMGKFMPVGFGKFCRHYQAVSDKLLNHRFMVIQVHRLGGFFSSLYCARHNTLSHFSWKEPQLVSLLYQGLNFDLTFTLLEQLRSLVEFLSLFVCLVGWFCTLNRQQRTKCSEDCL